MNIFTRHREPTCEEQLEELRRRVRELEFLIAKNPAVLDLVHESLIIHGINYSLAMFEQLGGGMQIGAAFELLDRAGGAVTLRQIRTELDARRLLKSILERDAARQAELAKLDRGDVHE